MDQQALIYDVDEASFESEVIQASLTTPVAVDFWAEWCAPCRALAPVLEKVVRSLAGKVRLAKLNTDQNQRLAAALQIRSLPTVKLVADGGVAGEFHGAHPEAQVREFFSRYLPQEADAASVEADELLRAGKADQALKLLQDAVAADPDNARLRLDLATVELSSGDYARAEATLRALPVDKQQDEAARRLFALVHFYRLCDNAPPLEELARAVERDPKDLDARLRLSARKVLEENYEAAMDQLLEVIRRNRSFRDDAARKSMLSIFELLGPGSPLAGRYRSLMAAAMY